MNRNDILRALRSFPFDPGEYWVLTGAAMVLYGIRESTSDIDLGCSAQMADRLEAEGRLYRRTENGKRWFRYGETIEVFEDWLFDTVEAVDGFRVISIRGLVEIKQSLGRDKDLRDLELIRTWLEHK